MLPLACQTAPDSLSAFNEALQRGLAARGLTPKECAASGAWPEVDALRLDLSGSIFSGKEERPKGGADGVHPLLTAARFEMAASPAQVMGAPVELALHASNAAFAFDGNPLGESLLVLTAATDGHLRVEATRDALEKLVLDLARKEAGAHGVDVKGAHLTLNSESPRCLAFSAEVTAKMFVVTAAVTISGKLTVDDQLNAKLSELAFHGEGMIGNLAGAYIRPHLAKVEGRTIALMEFAAGSIRLRDVQIAAGETLSVTAQFGS